VQRLASRHSPPVLLAAAVAVGLGGFLVTSELLREPPPAPTTVEVEPPAPTMRAPDPDLDGDGIADRFDGIFESCGSGGCAYEVYLRRPGGEDQYVGRMEGYWPFQIERLRADRPADVVAFWQLGATESVGTRYRFSRGKYRRFSESTCYREECTAEHIVHR
jgi:hypothetical protein